MKNKDKNMFPYANHTGTYKNIGKAYVPLFFVNTKLKYFVAIVGIDDYFFEMHSRNPLKKCFSSAFKNIATMPPEPQYTLS